jgi:hypothetical protein
MQEDYAKNDPGLQATPQLATYLRLRLATFIAPLLAQIT